MFFLLKMVILIKFSFDANVKRIYYFQFIYLFFNFESFHCWVHILKNCQVNAVEFPVIVINWISLG